MLSVDQMTGRSVSGPTNVKVKAKAESKRVICGVQSKRHSLFVFLGVNFHSPRQSFSFRVVASLQIKDAEHIFSTEFNRRRFEWVFAAFFSKTLGRQRQEKNNGLFFLPTKSKTSNLYRWPRFTAQLPERVKEKKPFGCKSIRLFSELIYL